MPIDPKEIKDSWQLTRSEAAALIGRCPSTITNLVRSGLLPVHRRSSSRKDTYYLGRELRAYLEAAGMETPRGRKRKGG